MSGSSVSASSGPLVPSAARVDHGAVSASLEEIERISVRDGILAGEPWTARRRWRAAVVALVVLGTLVAVVVQVRRPDPYTETSLVPWSHPVLTADERDVVVSVAVGACAEHATRTIVQETAEQVMITVVLVDRYADDHVACPAIQLALHAVAALRAPLGDRALVDGRCRQPASVTGARVGC